MTLRQDAHSSSPNPSLVMPGLMPSNWSIVPAYFLAKARWEVVLGCAAGHEHAVVAVVLADATADPDPEIHRALLDKVFPHQADIINADDLWTLSGGSLKL